MGKGNKILIDFIVELIKVLSCVDAVFKLLHVEVARKATDGERKKNEERKKIGFRFTVCKTEEN